MSRAWVALLLLAPLAGCAGGVKASDCGVSKGFTDGLSDQGHPIEIFALHDERPNHDVAFCVRLDEHGIIGKLMKGSRGVPNVDWIAKGAYASANVTVDAWLAGRGAHVNQTVDLTRTPYVVVMLDGQGALRLDVFEQRPGFA